MRRVKLNLDRDAWLIAWALTVLLHAGAILCFRGISPPKPPITIHRPEPIRFVFAGYKPETPKTQPKAEGPHFFSELPPDRADAAPKKADFLSNVTSRARDRVPGGSEGALPRMQGESDVPTVKLDPKNGSSSASTAALSSAAPPANASGSRPTQTTNPLGAASPQRSPTPEQPGPGAKSTPANPTESGATQPKSDEAIRLPKGSEGSSDIHQPEMDNPNGNASLTGDVSLNTIAWDYAPWLQRFGQQLMHRWIPPPAYTYGILKEGGWALIEVEILPSGKMVRLQLLEEQGHPSLSQAAQSALRSMAPIEHLPADFPEPSLILRIRMIYPKIRPRP